MTVARAIATNGVKNHQMVEPALAKTKAPTKNQKFNNTKHHHIQHKTSSSSSYQHCHCPPTNWVMILHHPKLPRVAKTTLLPTLKGGSKQTKS